MHEDDRRVMAAADLVGAFGHQHAGVAGGDGELDQALQRGQQQQAGDEKLIDGQGHALIHTVSRAPTLRSSNRGHLTPECRPPPLG
jgi:hypothetical protein